MNKVKLFSENLIDKLMLTWYLNSCRYIGEVLCCKYYFEVLPMQPWKNSDGKRVCDVNCDRTIIEIVRHGCKTRITVNPDGTLCLENIVS